eukprot:scaffold4008_cov267-Pinguiococcus_pyrenoidosus.AAC.4
MLPRVYAYQALRRVHAVSSSAARLLRGPHRCAKLPSLDGTGNSHRSVSNVATKPSGSLDSALFAEAAEALMENVVAKGPT